MKRRGDLTYETEHKSKGECNIWTKSNHWKRLSCNYCNYTHSNFEHEKWLDRVLSALKNGTPPHVIHSAAICHFPVMVINQMSCVSIRGNKSSQTAQSVDQNRSTTTKGPRCRAEQTHCVYNPPEGNIWNCTAYKTESAAASRKQFQILTLWEGLDPLTLFQRTEEPPHFGKCGRGASSEPAVEKRSEKAAAL